MKVVKSLFSFCWISVMCIVCAVNLWYLFEFSFTDAVYTERYMGKPSENSDAYIVNITQITSITIIVSYYCSFLTWYIITCDISVLFHRTPRWRPEQRISKQSTIFWFTAQQTVRFLLFFSPSEHVFALFLNRAPGNAVKPCTNGLYLPWALMFGHVLTFLSFL